MTRMLITMLALIGMASAAPYISTLSGLSGFPAYSSVYSSAYTPYAPQIIPGAVPATIPGLSAAYTRAGLGGVALGEYAYGLPNYASLAAPYTLPSAYGLEYVYGR